MDSSIVESVYCIVIDIASSSPLVFPNRSIGREKTIWHCIPLYHDKWHSVVAFSRVWIESRIEVHHRAAMWSHIICFEIIILFLFSFYANYLLFTLVIPFRTYTKADNDILNAQRPKHITQLAQSDVLHKFSLCVLQQLAYCQPEARFFFFLLT